MNASDSIIDQIYEAALVPEMWSSVLESLSEVAGCTGGLLLSARDHKANRTILTDSLREFYDRATNEGWWARNTRGKLLLTLPANEFHSDADYYSLEDMKREPLYADLLWPMGLGYATATHIQVPNGDTLILSLERPLERGPVERQAVESLTALRPHIARSALLASRLAFERIQSANEAFGMTGLPSAAIDAQGKLIDCNKLFEGRRDQALIDAGNKVRLANDDANRVLEQCLAAIRAGGPGLPFASRSIALPRTEGGDASVLHLVPVRGYARDIFTAAAYFIILTPLDGDRLAPIELIQGLFDLTTMEARVARALATGKDIDNTAQSFGISRETVRAHLKNIFSKTGFSRQTDLAAAISLVRTIE
ncbi:helix-turn-helix transcriptional regulator [Rhizobium sp. LjRoot254]|uniref:helix-turn-helix transcriptional regulator n=1 Tax=Rhizobium sp. LjRoot254 TaxID=3342297 RepID=UPI003ECCE984